MARRATAEAGRRSELGGSLVGTVDRRATKAEAHLSAAQRASRPLAWLAGLTIATLTAVAAQPPAQEPVATSPTSAAKDTANPGAGTQRPDQERSPDSSGDRAFQEEINVHLVQIPILAWDRQGNPVTDLRADEIVVKDRGQRREPAFLEPFVAAPEEEEEPLPEVALRVELPGVAERVVTSSGAEARNLIFLIDVENDQPLGKERAAHELMRFVESDLDESYRVAVLSYNGEIEVELPFTRDRTIIAAALDRAFGTSRRPQVDLQLRIRQLLDRLGDCVVSEGVVSRTADESCIESVGYEYSDENRPRAEDFLTGLEAVVRYAAGLEGRKSVVAVSHGVATEPWIEVREAMKAMYGNTSQLALTSIELMGEGVRHQMDDTIDLAIRSEVTLHFIDRTLAPAGDSGARQGSPFTPGARPMEVAFAAAQTDLKQIATATGGTFVASQSLYDGAKRAVEIEQAGYYLGFYTEGYLPKNRLTKISVDTTRKGVRLAHSRGTYAVAQGQIAEPVMRGKIALGKPTATSRDRLRVPFQISADPRDIGYQRVEDSAVANFTFHMMVEDEKSRALADSYHFVSHGYPWNVWQSQEAEPILIDGWVELPAGRYRLVAKFSNPRWPDRGGRLSRPLTVGSRMGEPAPSTSGAGAAEP